MTYRGHITCFCTDVFLNYITEEGEEAVCFSPFCFGKDTIKGSDSLEFPVVPINSQEIVGAVGPEATTVGIVAVDDFPDPGIYLAIAYLLLKGVRVVTLSGGGGHE